MTMQAWFRRIRKWLQTSSHVHIREDRVRDIRDVVDLIDRFLDDELAYGLEWDDFVSWTHDNPTIETIRNKIASLEPMFFAKDDATRAEAIIRLVDERNMVAALVGREPRGVPDAG